METTQTTYMEERPATKEEKTKAKFYISKEDIMKLPLGGFEGKIQVLYTEDRAEQAARQLLRHSMLGFDTETKPVFRKGQKQNPIALIQLSTEDTAYLFRVNEMVMPHSLRKVLESPEILKIGQALKHEIMTMKKEFGVEGRGFVDLLDIAHKIDTGPKSVRGLSALFLGIRISKRMQVTNWERQRLSEKQKRYAATDAWTCLEIYRKLKQRGLMKDISRLGHR